MDINRLDLMILKILFKEGCRSAIDSMTIREINHYNAGEQLCCRTQFGRRVNHLLELGYIRHGIKDNRADTYFITEEGVKVIEGEVAVYA